MIDTQQHTSNTWCLQTVQLYWYFIGHKVKGQGWEVKGDDVFLVTGFPVHYPLRKSVRLQKLLRPLTFNYKPQSAAGIKCPHCHDKQLELAGQDLWSLWCTWTHKMLYGHTQAAEHRLINYRSWVIFLFSWHYLLFLFEGWCNQRGFVCSLSFTLLVTWSMLMSVERSNDTQIHRQMDSAFALFAACVCATACVCVCVGISECASVHISRCLFVCLEIAILWWGQVSAIVINECRIAGRWPLLPHTQEHTRTHT